MGIQMDRSEQASALTTKLNLEIIKAANNFGKNHKVLGHLTGIPVTAAIVTVSTVGNIAATVEKVVKGVFNLIGGIFSPKLSCKTGLKQLFIKVPVGAFILAKTPLSLTILAIRLLFKFTIRREDKSLEKQLSTSHDMYEFAKGKPYNEILDYNL